MKSRIILLIVPASGLVSLCAQAENNNFYAGAKINSDKIIEISRNVKKTTVNGGLGAEINLGYLFSQYAAIEFGYSHFGGITLVDNDFNKQEYLPKFWSVAVKGMLPIGNDIAIQPKIGINFVTEVLKLSNKITGEIETLSLSEGLKKQGHGNTSVSLGIGASYKITANLHLEVSLDMSIPPVSKLDSSSKDPTSLFLNYGIGLRYHFA